MALTWPAKDPDEVLDYDIDWTDRLYSAAELILFNAGQTVVPADTIASSSWTITPPAGGTLAKNSDTFSTTSTKIWLKLGVIGDANLLTNRIVTAGGRTMDQSVKLKIKAK